MLKPGDNYYRIFNINNLDGSPQNADAIANNPSGVFNKNGLDDTTVKTYVTNLTTGRYVLSGVIPIGYAKGDDVNTGVFVTVSGVKTYSNLDRFELDSLRVGDLANFNPATTAVAVSGTVTTTLGVSGINSATFAANTTIPHVSFVDNAVTASGGTITTLTNAPTILSISGQSPPVGWGGMVLTSGAVNLNVGQTLGSAQVGGSLGYSLVSAEVQGAGKWTLSGTILTLYRADGTTVWKTFTLDSATSPTSRS